MTQRLTPTDLQLIRDRENIQLIFFGDSQQEKSMLDVMPSCESTRWHPDFTDIIPKGSGKLYRNGKNAGSLRFLQG